MSSKQLSVLIVVTSHARLGDTGRSTGLWLEELAVPYIALKEAGARVTIASPRGGPVPVDPASRDGGSAVTQLLADPEGARGLEQAVPLSEVDAASFDAVFFPGGHGTMWDLPEDTRVAELVSTFLASGRPVAAVCHGPAALVGARDADGRPVVAGRRVSTFTDDEEERAGLTSVVPFLLERRLSELGARIERGPAFAPRAVRDGLLVTGQNPASSGEVARLLIEALS